MSTNLCCRCCCRLQFHSIFYLTLFFVTLFYSSTRVNGANGDTGTTIIATNVTTTSSSSSAEDGTATVTTTTQEQTTFAAPGVTTTIAATAPAEEPLTGTHLVLKCSQPNYPHNTKEICLIEPPIDGKYVSESPLPVTIVSNDPTNVTAINITGVPLGNVPAALGDNFTKLEILALNNCNITSLAGLGSVPRLKKLYLDANQLTEVEEGQLAGVPNLRLFEATDNQIESISSKAFAGNLLLYWLDLGRNRIGGLPWGCFEGLTSLVSLVLSHNMIDDIRGVFQGLEGLSTLDLSYNAIREIHDSTFERTTNLEKLYLQHNKIEQLARTAFDHCSRLKSIDLSHNQLQSFHFDLPSGQLEMFNIAFNQLSEFALTSRLERHKDLKISAQNNSISTFFVQEGIPVTELYLHHNQLKSLISLTKLYSLTVLNLRGNDLSETTTDLEAFKNLQRLVELDLSHTRINKDYLPVLFQLENLNRYLDLSENPSVAELAWGQLSPSPLAALGLNACNLTALNVEGIRTTLQRLSEIEINDNRFACNELRQILINLAVSGIDVKKTDKAGDGYIEGILCLNESRQITKLEPVTTITLKAFTTEETPQSDQSLFTEQSSESDSTGTVTTDANASTTLSDTTVGDSSDTTTTVSVGDAATSEAATTETTSTSEVDATEKTNGDSDSDK